MKYLFALVSSLAVACFFAAPVFAVPAEEKYVPAEEKNISAELKAIIARARAAVGPEDALNAVKAISFEAEIFDKDGKKTADILLQFKRPYFEREVVRRADTVPADDFYYPEEGAAAAEPKTVEYEIETISDGESATRIVRNLTEKTRNIVFLPATDVISRRDFTDANLDFYATPRGGTAVYKGDETVEGKTVALVEYTYAGGLKIERGFDRASGALFVSRNNGLTTFDVGEKMVSGGLSFFDGSRSFDADGNTKFVFKFKKISVNDDVPDDVFRLSIDEIISGK